MPLLALVLGFAFFMIAVVWRSSAQYIRTGDHGFRGISRGAPPIEHLASVLLFLGIILAILTPILMLKSKVVLFPFLQHNAVHGVGFGLAVVGIVGTSYSQWHMGSSWRIGVDQTEVNTLVTTGPFSRIRNPIFTGIMVFGTGLCLLVPHIWMWLGMALIWISVELQVRYIEEPFLKRIHGEPYQHYASRVGRFVPGIGLL